MELDANGVHGAYTNRSAGRARAAAQLHRLGRPSPLHTTGRAVDRMLVALRGYEQRAQRRAALHAWLTARRAATSSEA